MKALELIIGVLALVGLGGLIYLLTTGADTVVLLPIVSLLIGWLVGKKQDVVVSGIFKKK